MKKENKKKKKTQCHKQTVKCRKHAYIWTWKKQNKVKDQVKIIDITLKKEEIKKRLRGMEDT